MERNVGYTPCYGADMRCLFQLLLNRRKNVVEVHKLFTCMFNCIFFLRKIVNAGADEDLTSWQRDLEMAKDDLRECMRAWCLLDSDKNLIWSLVQRSV